MENKIQIRVWPGERKLLPIENIPDCYQLCCLGGEGYLRVMSSSRRCHLKPGFKTVIEGGEIATVTGKQDMLIEFQKLSK